MGQGRIRVARWMIRAGKALQSYALMVMRPDDLVEFGRQKYARSEDLQCWGGDAVVRAGLYSDEEALWAKTPVRSGRLLLLGVGGGREAICFARRGFSVTGMDFVAAMVEMACSNAAREGIHLEGLTQEISKLDVPAGSYDLVWLSWHMYSCIPTRQRRVEMLKRVAAALRPGGCFVCQFHWNPRLRVSPRGVRFRRWVAALTGGYRQFEPGDILREQQEFICVFGDERELRAELEESGMAVLHFEVFDGRIGGGAVLQKAN